MTVECVETPKQLARRVGVSEYQIKKLIEAGQLEHVLIVKRVHIPHGNASLRQPREAASHAKTKPRPQAQMARHGEIGSEPPQHQHRRAEIDTEFGTYLWPSRPLI